MPGNGQCYSEQRVTVADVAGADGVVVSAITGAVAGTVGGATNGLMRPNAERGRKL